ncbi:Maf family protein [Haematobacter missouriensis]|uniref:Nucleoside triphosphate pyrophosphatase n=1 Tax=Haematobacter missouriensis TaxID=366616 RepID=A0A212AM36_9RHOB|nr:Maf family nucleotide pyrophosphatase [Haematobacter missouriensis]OWJ73141.1 septum formation protein Maf [Haematobacter missouriensis]OWJ82542.1 septum formation protein Maf [Haematobacter missouriensis]
MMVPLVLASVSEIRSTLLRNAGVTFETVPARIDEVTIRAALEAEGAKPRDVADALAEFKARKVAEKRPEALVIGCDQVLECEGRIYGKPETRDAAKAQLLELRGRRHRLLSAAVVYEAAAPVWRQIGEVSLTMRTFSDDWLDGYVARNWESIRHAVGAYKLEEEGVRLFSRIEGDYFSVLGLPLVELLNYLAARKVIPS